MSWLRSQDEGPIRWLTIDRPQRMNAIPFQGWRELCDAFREFESSAARVLIVRGEGGDFCAGADLDPTDRKEMSSVVERHLRMKTVGEAAIELHRLTKPAIAAVDGVAVGAGMNLALGCDVVVCSERARFSEIFVRRGLTLDFAGSWILPRVVGLQRARELALSGRIFDAEEAVSLGIAMEAVAPDRLYERAEEIAHSLLSGAPFAQMLIKRALASSLQTGFPDAVASEGHAQTVALGTEDAQEGFASFIDKRDPNWKGR
ncbi:MAG: enoyl-CoA hydratase/isomerase family protein [Acidimicrobiia bacterium]